MADPRVNIMLPADKAEGHYADFVAVWNTADVFVIDFAAVTSPPQPVDDGSGEPTMTTHAQIVTRVRIPPAQVFEIMKALNGQLAAWESATGKGGSLPPPDAQ